MTTFTLTNAALPRALHHLRSACELDEQSARYAFHFGKALLLSGDPEAAVPYLEKGHDIEGTPAAAYLRAAAYFFSGNLESALQWSDAALESPGLFARAHALRAEVRRSVGDFNDALEDWRSALSISVDNDYIRLKGASRILEWALIGPQSDRIPYLELAKNALIAGMPKDYKTEHRYILGCTFLELGDPRRALIHFSKIAEDATADVQLRIGVSEMMLGNHREGHQHLSRVIAQGGFLSEDAARLLDEASLPGGLIPGEARLPLPELDGILPMAVDLMLPIVHSGDVVEHDALLVMPGAEGGSAIELEASPQRAATPCPFTLDAVRQSQKLVRPRPPAAAPDRERQTAQGHFRAAGERLLDCREDLAAATLCRAFDTLDREGLDTEEDHRLRYKIVRALVALVPEPGVLNHLVARAGGCLEDLVERDPQLGRSLAELALEVTESPARLEFLVKLIECRVPMVAGSAQSIHEALGKALRVTTKSSDPEVKARLPFLQRLHVARPELAYPRLYIARAYALIERYEEALDLLSGVHGSAALRANVLNLRGRCAELVHRMDEAEECFLRSLAANGEQADIHFRAGRIALRRAVDARGYKGTLAMDVESGILTSTL